MIVSGLVMNNGDTQATTIFMSLVHIGSIYASYWITILPNGERHKKYNSTKGNFRWWVEKETEEGRRQINETSEEE